jgi:MFS transporter, putative metabolite:H+ symporter
MRAADRLDRLPLGRFHYRLLLLSGFGWLFDSMDTGLVSFVLARLKTEWSLAPGQVAFAGSAGLFGMFLGGACAGALADRFGRKAVFQWTLLLFSVATGLCAFASGFASLVVLRVIVGFGLGGELPVAAALVTEFAPAAQRGRLLVLLESFWAIGWALAALASDRLAAWAAAHGEPFPWRVAFLLGALPALYVFVLRRSLPESPRFLVSRGRIDEAEAIVCAVECGSSAPAATATPGPHADPGRTRLAPEPPEPPARLGDLFSPALRRRTSVLWALWFAMAFSYYGLFIWLPTLLVGRWYAEVQSFRFTLFITLAQIPGYFVAAWLVERAGRRATLAPFLALCAGASWLFGHATDTGGLLLWGCFVSFFNLGAWGVTYGYTPELYPTRLRGTGTGSAAAFGRIGGILAPLVVGRLLAAGGAAGTAANGAAAVAGAKGGFAAVFTLFTAVLLLGAAAVAIFGEETRGRTLEQIAGS